MTKKNVPDKKGEFFVCYVKGSEWVNEAIILAMASVSCGHWSITAKYRVHP